MNTENVSLMRAARDSLKGQWGLAILTFFLYTLLTAGPGSLEPRTTHVPTFSLLILLIGGPMALGAAIFSLAISRGKTAKIEQLFEGFQNFGNALVTYLLMLIYIFLWFLLLIIPGIIAALGYAMTFYILADDPTLKPQEALKKSKIIMNGHKMKLFTLSLRFLGLAILCILTLGIGFFWLIPFIHVTMAKFYDDVNGTELFA